MESGKAVTDLVDEYLAMKKKKKKKKKKGYGMLFQNRFFNCQFRKDWSVANNMHWKNSKKFIEDFNVFIKITKSG